MIEGVKLTNLKVIKDDRGSVCHMLRLSDEHFRGFGEIYFSTINPGVVKAWHLHKKMWLNYCCVEYIVVVVLCDLRPGSPTFGQFQKITLTDPDGLKYRLLTIPPEIWNGFRIPMNGVRNAIVANCATLVHDPSEIVRCHPKDFPLLFDWGKYDIAG